MIRTCAMLLFGSLLAAGSAFAADEGLQPFVWKNRVLLVFSDPDSALAAEQKRLTLSDPSALDERDMVMLLVSGDTVTALHGMARGATASALRREAGISSGVPFSVVLVGKDGGIKLRSETPVSSAELFGLIDSMPMRAREAQR